MCEINIVFEIFDDNFYVFCKVEKDYQCMIEITPKIPLFSAAFPKFINIYEYIYGTGKTYIMWLGYDNMNIVLNQSGCS